MSRKLRAVVILVLVILPLDQLSKLWVAANVSPFKPIEVIDGFFSITHARNSGAALGLLQGLPPLVFILLTLVALGFIYSFYRQVGPEDLLQGSSLGLILAGAIGNLIDRVAYGEVVDFLHFNLGLFIFPDFNFADSAIVIGVGLLLLDLVATETEESVRDRGET